MQHFCTYLDSNYLVRGLALYESLVEHAGDFRLYVLCFDDAAHAFLSGRGYERVTPISQAEFEKDDPDLVRCKSGRSSIEYFFTCTPSLPLYVLNHFSGVDLISYIDADMYFFSSPAPIFREFGGNSILTIAHRFSQKNRHLEKSGKFNVGFLSFRNDEWGRKCLEWWRGKCIEWCYDRIEENRFADQKYLDEWPSRFERVCQLQHKGVNLAPWNIDNYSFRTEGKHLLVDGDPLLLFHFQGFNSERKGFYSLSTRKYAPELDRELMLRAYTPYIKNIEAIEKGTGLFLGGNRYHDRRARSLQDIFWMAASEEILCHVSGLPVVNLSRLMRPLYYVLLKSRHPGENPGPGK